MNLRDHARQMAETGEYEDARAVIFALFKLGYSRAPGSFNLIDRMRLTHVCKSSSRRKRKRAS
ncbi:MAG: hypothetical protein DI605_08745 [Sphingomonas sp.]|nr:MAG: hypothetical protein DI605_08745 [Sphingomonas sp.]